VAQHTLVASYRLDDPAHLFVAPNDPFSPDYGIAPVLDDVVNDLYTTTSYRHVNLTLELRPEHTTEAWCDKIRLGIQRYCEQSERDLDRTRRGERFRAAFALSIALVALVVFVIINRSLRDETDFWVEVVIEGLAIAFWVAVWFPVDSLLFGQWQHRLDGRIYRTLAAADVAIVPVGEVPATDPAAGSSSVPT
jgi:hypothetical protein